MYITSIHLSDFGKFKNNEIYLEEGINCIYGKNEDGKSTIKSFLTFMFLSLHQPYSYDLIFKEFSRYQPFYSDEFKGYLTCKDLVGDSDEEYKVFKDFNCSGVPEVTKRSDECDSIRPNLANVIGFQELQGEKSKNLIVDIFGRIEALKGSNIENLDVGALRNDIEEDKNLLKREMEYVKLSKRAKELKEALKGYDAKYADYKEAVGSVYHIEHEKDVLQREIEIDKKTANRIALQDLESLYSKVIGLNSQIASYKSELEVLEKYANVDIDDVDELVIEESKVKAVEKNLESLKETYFELSLQSQKISLGRDYDKVGLLSEEVNINIIRGNVELLKEKYEVVENLKSSMDELYELKKEAAHEDVEIVNHEEDIFKIAKLHNKYISIRDWGESLNAQLSEAREKLQNSQGVDGLVSQKKTYGQLFYIMSFLLLVGIGSVFLSGNFLLGVFPLAFILLMVVTGYKRLKIQDDIRQIIHDKRIWEEDIEKHTRSILNNQEKLEQIIHDSGCKTFSELESKYKETSEVQNTFSGLANRTHELKQQIDKEEVSLRLTEKRILDMENRYSLELNEYINDPEILRKKVEGYINDAKKFNIIEAKRFEIQNKIDELNTEQSVSVDATPNMANDLEESIQKYQLAQFELEQAIKLKDMNLNRITEEQLVKFMERYEENPNIEPIILSDESKKYLDNASELSKGIIDKNREMEVKKLEVEKLETYFEDAKKMKAELLVKEMKLEKLNQKEDRLDYVTDYLLSSTAAVRFSISHLVEEKVGEIIYKITDKYSKVKFSEEMDLQFFNEETKEYQSVECLSAGTIDQMYISLRIALVELAKGNNNYPLIFDDSFVQYDKKRLHRVLDYLSQLNRQIIIMTCQKRENKILETFNIDYNYINLSEKEGTYGY